jgi:hypothetical protein
MTPFQNPSIYFFNLRIDEPISSLTDIVLSAVCFYAFYKTKSLANSKAINLYRWFFLLTGLSTIFAAILGHAFLYYFGLKIKMVGWIFGIAGISFAIFASLHHTRSFIGEIIFKQLRIVNFIELIIAYVCVFTIWSFVVVEIHSAYGLLLYVTILEYINYKKTKSAMSLYLLYGIGISVLAIFCHIFILAFSVWFNHIDLSHSLMTVSMFIMYKGIKLQQVVNNK